MWYNAAVPTFQSQSWQRKEVKAMLHDDVKSVVLSIMAGLVIELLKWLASKWFDVKGEQRHEPKQD